MIIYCQEILFYFIEGIILLILSDFHLQRNRGILNMINIAEDIVVFRVSNSDNFSIVPGANKEITHKNKEVK